MYRINVTIHVLAAILWLGGMFFFAAVGAPVLRKVEPAQLRAELFQRLGEKARSLGWGSIIVLLVTGVLNLHFRGLLGADAMGSGAFWSTAYGHALMWKLGAVAAMLIVQAVHDFRFGPAASRAAPGTAEALRLRRRAALLARASGILGIIVVIAAVYLARPG
jgi:copper resistance protein D